MLEPNLSVSYDCTQHLKIRKTVSLQDCYHDNKISGGFACGLSCRLCLRYYSRGQRRCRTCKSEYRMPTRCLFKTYSVKRKKIGSCGARLRLNECERWGKHRDYSLHHDTVVWYQKLGGFNRLFKMDEQKLMTTRNTGSFKADAGRIQWGAQKIKITASILPPL